MTVYLGKLASVAITVDLRAQYVRSVTSRFPVDCG